MDNFWETFPIMGIMTLSHPTALSLRPFLALGAHWELNLRVWQRSTGILIATQLNDVSAAKVVITQNSRFHLTQIRCFPAWQIGTACMYDSRACFVNMMWDIQPRITLVLSNQNSCVALLWSSSIPNHASLAFLFWCWLNNAIYHFIIPQIPTKYLLEYAVLAWHMNKYIHMTP